MEKQNRQSPLKNRPLRNPGQSLDEELKRIFDDDIFPSLVVFTLVVGMAIMEWVRWLLKAPYYPFLFTVFAIVAIAVFTVKVFRTRERINQLKLGRDGEKAVGQYLDLLRHDGHRIFHDIIADNFNIDHVIISDRGIFAVETKTYSKPTSGKAIIEYKGGNVFINGSVPDRNPVEQVSALANWLKTALKESTGKEYPVRGVILFPGWWVENPEKDFKNNWVLNPKALPKFLENEPSLLRVEDVQLATYHLSRYIRTH